MLSLFVTFNMKTVCIVLYVNPQWQQTRCTNNVNVSRHTDFRPAYTQFSRDFCLYDEVVMKYKVMDVNLLLCYVTSWDGK